LITQQLRQDLVRTGNGLNELTQTTNNRRKEQSFIEATAEKIVYGVGNSTISNGKKTLPECGEPWPFQIISVLLKTK